LHAEEEHSGNLHLKKETIYTLTDTYRKHQHYKWKLRGRKEITRTLLVRLGSPKPLKRFNKPCNQPIVPYYWCLAQSQAFSFCSLWCLRHHCQLLSLHAEE
jgi:hypothetical protein